MVGSVYSREVGDDNNITFWRDVWVEKSSLKDKYPRPFLLFEQHDAMLKDMGLWEEGVWQVELILRRRN